HRALACALVRQRALHVNRLRRHVPDPGFALRGADRAGSAPGTAWRSGGTGSCGGAAGVLRGGRTMTTLWFILVTFMLTMYVLLDGFDLGAGVIHLLVARSDAERRTVLRAIGPVWDGNEVWLIAAVGTLFFAFPLLYASSVSGLYLPLI